jgi:hypothetical protein
MNRRFKEYYELRSKGEVPVDVTLRQIGIDLGLGYSTILHKFKEFKDNREVKGGFLLEMGDAKRKYKKSFQIEQLIKEALN